MSGYESRSQLLERSMPAAEKDLESLRNQLRELRGKDDTEHMIQLC